MEKRVLVIENKIYEGTLLYPDVFLHGGDVESWSVWMDDMLNEDYSRFRDLESINCIYVCITRRIGEIVYTNVAIRFSDFPVVNISLIERNNGKVIKWAVFKKLWKKYDTALSK